MFVIRTIKEIRAGNTGLVVPAPSGGGGPPAGVDIGNGWGRIGSVANGSSNTQSVTTPGLDSTGADLLVALVGLYNSTPLVGDISDSLGITTWSLISYVAGPSGTTLAMYAANPGVKVGTGHTFTFNRGGIATYPSLVVMGFAGCHQTTPTDGGATNGYISPGTSITLATFTPTVANDLFICGLATAGPEGGTPTISLSFNLFASLGASTGAYMGSFMAYLTQASPAGLAPVWNWPTSLEGAALLQAFKHA